MKQKLSIFLAVLCLISLVACSKVKPSTNINITSSNSRDDSLNISISKDDTENLNYIEESKDIVIVQSSVEDYTFNEMIDSADLIAEVDIINIIGEANEPMARTYFKAKVRKDLSDPEKGIEKEIVVKQDGNSSTIFDGVYQFQPKDRLILFLKKFTDGSGRYWILGEPYAIYCIRSIDNKDYVYQRIGSTPELVDIEEKNSIKTIQSALEKSKRKHEYIEIVQAFEKEKFLQKIINAIEVRKNY